MLRCAVLQGRQIDPKTFPEAILNGSRLDLFNLYRCFLHAVSSI